MGPAAGPLGGLEDESLYIAPSCSPGQGIAHSCSPSQAIAHQSQSWSGYHMSVTAQVRVLILSSRTGPGYCQGVLKWIAHQGQGIAHQSQPSQVRNWCTVHNPGQGIYISQHSQPRLGQGPTVIAAKPVHRSPRAIVL